MKKPTRNSLSKSYKNLSRANRSKQILNLFLRYIIILLLGAGNLFIFYKTLTPITVYTLKIILNIFTQTTLTENLLILSTIKIQLIPACIAGSAYYLLLILNLSTANIKLNKRIKILILTFITLFILNILRILLLITINSTIFFQPIHELFWYAISTIFVIATWIFTVKHYKIKQIPVYDDIKFLYKLIKKK